MDKDQGGAFRDTAPPRYRCRFCEHRSNLLATLQHHIHERHPELVDGLVAASDRGKEDWYIDLERPGPGDDQPADIVLSLTAAEMAVLAGEWGAILNKNWERTPALKKRGLIVGQIYTKILRSPWGTDEIIRK